MSDDYEPHTWQDFFDYAQDEILPEAQKSEEVPDEAIEFFDELLSEDRDPERANEKFDEWMGDDED